MVGESQGEIKILTHFCRQQKLYLLVDWSYNGILCLGVDNYLWTWGEYLKLGYHNKMRNYYRRSHTLSCHCNISR